MNTPAYEYIKQLQQRGYLLQLNPTSLPYTEREVLEAVENEDKESVGSIEEQWFTLLLDQLELPVREEEAEARYGVNFSAGNFIGNTRRKSTIRPLDNDVFAYPAASLNGYLEKNSIVANVGLQHDLYYDRDPDGIDAARRLYVRSENAYIGYNEGWLRVYLGRFDNHWAPYEETSSVLSRNPHSIDQLNVLFKSDKLSLRSIFGELDNISADNIFAGRANGPGAIRRFFVAHRFDWYPSDSFRLTFFESNIYSGENSGFSFKYFNPLHTYLFMQDNSPKNDENNLLFGGMLWYQWQNWTLNTQMMLDDFQVGSNLEKHTFTFTTSLHKAKLYRNLDLGLEFEAVSYQTYTPMQPEGRYLYLKRGIATQYNDYVLGAIYADFYADSFIEGLKVTPKVQLLLQGEQTINQPLVMQYPDGRPIDYILTGTEEQTVRPSISFRYQPSPHVWLEGDLGANFVSDYNHQPGISHSRFAGELSFKLDFTLFEN